MDASVGNLPCDARDRRYQVPSAGLHRVETAERTVDSLEEGHPAAAYLNCLLDRAREALASGRAGLAPDHSVTERGQGDGEHCSPNSAFTRAQVRAAQATQARVGP